MGSRNVLAWDFAKLETELKVRLLPQLFAQPDARSALMALPEFPHWKAEPRDPDVERTLFFHQFETRLAALTERIETEQDALEEARLPAVLSTAFDPVNRLLCILWRTRKEAALCLGFRRGRQRYWLNEFYFTLGAYGLCNAKPKWDYDPRQTRCALVSAGVAVAQLEKRLGTLRDQIAAEKPPAGSVASYRVPLAHAHRLWKQGSLESALALLESAHEQFGLSVPLKQEYALVLADMGEREKDPQRTHAALRLVEPLRDFCRTFRDHETLSRLGKIFRSHGDAVWHPGTRAEFLKARANDYQYYCQAKDCYRQAFEFNRVVLK
jgi:hypothetical protein